MTDLNTVNLYNTSDTEQQAYMPDGKRVAMAPFEIRPWPREVADVFLAQRGKYIQKYQAMYIPPSPGEAITYIANLTGNPHEPEELTKTQFDRQRGLDMPYTVPNPMRVARPVEYEMQGEQVVKAGEGGVKYTLSTPPKRVKIPPMVRLPVPRSSAEWLIRRDAQCEEGYRGSVVECRGPSDFEPNESWTIDDVLLYMKLMDPRTAWKKFVVGQDEQEKKLNLYRAVFPRLVDEKYSTIPKHAFDAAKIQLAAQVPPPNNPGNNNSGARA